MSVHVWKPSFPVDWRLRVKEHITHFGKPLYIFFYFSIIFLRFKFFSRIGVFANKPFVDSGELAGGGSVAVAVGVSDR